jgi:competence protein ComEC
LTRLGFAGVERLAEALDAQPLSPLFVVAPHPAICVLALAAGCTGWLAPQPAVRTGARVVFALAIVWLHLGPPPADFALPGAALLDVGQGQALFWHAAGGTTLIDAAGRGYGRWDPGASIVRPALFERGVQRLDRLVLSHGHADHAAGAFAVIDAFEIGELWLGPGWWRDRRLADLAAHARHRGAAVRLVSRGDRAPGIRILGPSRENLLKDNAASLVLTLGIEPWSLFVPGDLDGAALQRFLSKSPPGEAGAIVLAHHGSRHGTPAALLNAVRPDSALVSCGWKNRFGHPHRETIERLDRREVPLWRTDHHGTITLTAGPGGWRIESAR